MGAQVWESMACIVFLIGLDGEVGICQHFFMLTNLYWCANSWCFLGNQCAFFCENALWVFDGRDFSWALGEL